MNSLIPADYVRLEVEWQTPPQRIADFIGLPLLDLIHLLAAQGDTTESVLLANAARVRT